MKNSSTAKTILLSIIIISLLGCGAVNSKMNKILDAVHPGMTIQEFKEVAPKSTLVQMMDNYERIGQVQMKES